MSTRILSSILVLSLLGFTTACSDARDVKVKGDVSAETGVDTDHPIRLEVYEPKNAGDADGGALTSALSLVDAFTLEAPGAFDETVSVTGDRLHLVALVDANGNEQCDAGEAWGEADTDVSAEDTAEFVVHITKRVACPELPSAE